MISGNMVGSYSQIGKTFILVDEDGMELTGVITENVHVFDATPADVKIGKTFVSDDGVLEGIDTRTYHTTHAVCLILPGENFSIPLEKDNKYDYTKFQAMIAKFNTTEFDSVAVDKVSINDVVYDANSTVKLSDVTKNSLSQSIDLNIANNTDNFYIVHYNTYKEE